MPEAVVTTSWDDGHVMDMVLAELLDRYAVPATFYIAPRNREILPSRRLRPVQIRELSSCFEVGGHTLTHIRLPTVADADARAEIRAGREFLEDCVGKPVRSFCYPGGAFDERHPPMVRAAGFALARTIDRHTSELSPCPYRMGTTMHAYRHLVDPPAALRMAGWSPSVAWRYYRNWDDWAVAWFERVVEKGGIFHLWGHAWEIDARGDWGRLERVLAHISRWPGLRYATNGEVGGSTRDAIATTGDACSTNDSDREVRGP